MPDPASLALEKVEALLRAAEHRGFGLLEYQEAGMHLRVSFAVNQAAALSETPFAGTSPSALPVGATAPHEAILSPGVGFLRCSDPAGEKFPVEGEEIAAGAVVALIRAGPLFQPVSAPRAGRLGRQLAADGAAVAFGTALFEFV